MARDDCMEAEATAFAMELLMPEQFLRADLEKIGSIDIESDKNIAKLAKRYRVSEQVMTIRIAQLMRRTRTRSVGEAVNINPALSKEEHQG